jgi:ankyrin repeat protein
VAPQTYVASQSQIKRKALTGRLLHAAKRGDCDYAKTLLRRGADPNGKNKFGFAPLMKAVESDNPDVIRLLLENGADPNQKDNTSFGRPALIWALFWCQINAAKALIENEGTNLKIQDNEGYTPLTMAMEIESKTIIALLRRK